MTDKAIQKWADKAMFEAEPMQKEEGQEFVTPQVHLLWMTPEPLRAIAAMCRMYEGKATYDLQDITADEMNHYFEQVQKTHLKAPLESVKMHFFFEGIDRAHSHQIVRQRTAVYAQESMRFAVKENLADEASVPPHIQVNEQAHQIYRVALEDLQSAYNALVNMGVPAEDARALLPHSTTTRMHYVTDLRALADHAGNRLCTQAQFVWRILFAKIVQAIREYDPYKSQPHHVRTYIQEDNWQFEILAESPLFRPVCYQLGHCPFTATFDRACSIRERVEWFAKDGIPSEHWGAERIAVTYGTGDETKADYVPGIKPEEWLANPDAAIER